MLQIKRFFSLTSRDLYTRLEAPSEKPQNIFVPSDKLINTICNHSLLVSTYSCTVSTSACTLMNFRMNYKFNC